MSHAQAIQRGLADEAAVPAQGRWLVPVARFLFAAIFIFAAPGHFSSKMIEIAAAQGVPLAGIAVPLSGLMALAGGLSLLLGYRTRWGAALLVLFLVPVTFAMHKFWAESDAMMRQMQMVMFLKNLALIGGAVLIGWFGAGPLSLDAWLQRRRGARDVELGPPTLTPSEAG